MAEYVNRHGRKGGRGLRPWLLGPKVVCVGVYLGGLMSSTVVWSLAMRRAQAGEVSVELLDLLRLLFLCVVVPGLLGAIVFGGLLFVQHPRQFVRLRWWQVKVGLVVLMVPTAHLFMSARLVAARGAAARGVHDASAMGQFGSGLWVVIVLSVVIALLGRLKPRLGQNWARAYRGSG